MELIVLFIFLGGCSGLLAGLLGIGGGIITVPALYYILNWKGYPPHEVMQIAIATSLACVVITTGVSTWAHYLRKAIQYNVLGYLLPGLIIGCISGAQLVHLLPGELLRMIFGAMAILIGIYFAIPAMPLPKISERPNPLLSFFGLIIGHLSSFLGVGGGIFSIPLLFAYSLPSAKVSATSSAATLATCLVGTLTYLAMSEEVRISGNTFGFIDIPSFICISLGSISTVRFGVKLAHYVSAPTIKRVFGIVLSLTGIAMIFR